MSPKDTEQTIIKCAIYTRKSTQEGLDEDFTTLDAQRESAESYIASQKSQGWITLPQKYDDGGFTGANIDRPALQRLLQDVSDGKVDTIIVYKVDRLSRSLLDFTRLLEIFEQHNVTFVSVTQHFNTNSSMGRLTLNILLSFAQFEREMISERTADKMGAARRKGKFIGGRPALGYNVDKENHALVINPKEAALVRLIFDLYIKKKSLLKVSGIINGQGYRTKQHKIKSGKTWGGKLFQNTSIQWIIKNPLYTGKVLYKGELFDGLHEPIISDDTFQQAQVILKENTRQRTSPNNTKYIGLLSDLIYCQPCQKKMYYTYARKKNRHYKYYICRTATKHGYSHCPTRMMAAHLIEGPIVSSLNIAQWDELLFDQQRQKIVERIKRIDVERNLDRLTVCYTDNTETLLSLQPTGVFNPKKEFQKLPAIKQLLLLAHHIQQMLDSKKSRNLKEISAWTGISLSRLYQISSFLNLCPDIQSSIILDDAEKIRPIPEYKIRPILKESNPAIQQKMWEKLLKIN